MLIKRKNIHMDRIKCSASTQMTIDADINVPDSKPDVTKILLEKGWIKIEEVKALENQVLVRGNLCFAFLYQCEYGDRNVSCMEGKIPFEEMVHVEGANSQDTVKVRKQLEDLSIGMINSRKISVRAVAVLEPEIEELYDEEVLYDVEDVPMLQKKTKQLLTTEAVIEKRDMLRIREEIKIPSNLPNIFEIIWDTVRICSLEFRVGDGKLYVQGEIQVFFLYEAEGEDGRLVYFETKLPVNMQLECSDCTEDMIPIIRYDIIDRQLEIRPDEDGEDRIVETDMNVELDIKLYREEKTDILEDVYGVTEEVTGVFKTGHYRKLFCNERNKCIATGRIKMNPSKSQMLQVCAVSGELAIDDTTVTENGMQVDGAVELQLLYTDLKEPNKFFAANGSVPFACKVDVKNMNAQTSSFFDATISQITFSMPNNEEVEVNIQINLHLSAFQNMEEEFLNDIRISELNSEKMKGLPSMIGYIAKEGDTLWQLGKRYYVPIGQIAEANHLTTQELHRGDKLIIVKSMEKKI